MLELMKSEGLKSSQLADMLGINPAGISHILAGRNKPGFDLLQKILRRFPRISPDWLLLDNGPMYRDAENTGAASDEKTPELFARSGAEPQARPDELFARNEPSTPQQPFRSERTAVPPTAAAAPENPHGGKSEAPATGTCGAAVKRIVIFYEDGAFESYFPTMR